MYFLELVFFIIFKILKTISIPLALVDAKKTIAYPAKNCVNENVAGILEIMLEIIFMTVPHNKSGLVPRSSLSGAGQLGFWESGEGGIMGEGWVK